MEAKVSEVEVTVGEMVDVEVTVVVTVDEVAVVVVAVFVAVNVDVEFSERVVEGRTGTLQLSECVRVGTEGPA